MSLVTGAVPTLNAGASSLKAALFPSKGDMPLATGLADRIGPAGTLAQTDAAGAAIPQASATPARWPACVGALPIWRWRRSATVWCMAGRTAIRRRW